MFTGIVEERGTVLETGAFRLVVGCRTVVSDSEIGASVAVNGVCLTVVARGARATCRSTCPKRRSPGRPCGRLGPGDPVNLERPVTLSARLGGHLVQGHVDGVGEVSGIDRDDEGGAVLTMRVPERLLRYVGGEGVDLGGRGEPHGRRASPATASAWR